MAVGTEVLFLAMIAGPRPIEGKTANIFAKAVTLLSFLFALSSPYNIWIWLPMSFEFFVIWLGIFLESLSPASSLFSCLAAFAIYSARHVIQPIPSIVFLLAAAAMQGITCHLLSLLVLLRYSGAVSLPCEFGREATVSFVRRRRQWTLFFCALCTVTLRFAAHSLVPSEGASRFCLYLSTSLFGFVGSITWSYCEYYCSKQVV